MTPILNSGNPEAHRRTAEWLSQCLSNPEGRHRDCMLNAAGQPIASEEAPRLPKRVLDVGSERDGMMVHLVESEGKFGQYFALSHCWDPPDQLPLRTTTATLASHVAGIPLAALTKTFHDAVSVTRAQGVRFLWIDSLCIVQDDRDDWEREARAMASVYEQALLVIVAADAANPHEGLFFEREQYAPGVELSYYGIDGNPMGSFYVWWDPVGLVTSPLQDSPLKERGWAMQEWLLSRRRVYFCKIGMYWECREHAHDERGRCTSLLTDSVEYWDTIVTSYSAKQFTYPSDRLIALEGMRSRYANRRNSAYHYGTWYEDMMLDLLWQAKGRASRLSNPLKVPSWSWLSALCPVKYDWFDRSMGATNIAVLLGVDPLSGALRMRTLVGPAPDLFQLDHSPEADGEVFHDSRITTCRRLGMSPEEIKAMSETDMFVVADSSHKRVGNLRIDEGVLPPPSSPLFLIALSGLSAERVQKYRYTEFSLRTNRTIALPRIVGSGSGGFLRSAWMTLRSARFRLNREAFSAAFLTS